MTYGHGFSGSEALRAAITRSINHHFHLTIPTSPTQIVVTAGVTNAFEATAWSLGDPGDAILLGRPFYASFVGDLHAHAEYFPHKVDLHEHG